MGTLRGIIAVFGGAIYEDKSYSFLRELDQACRKSGYMVLAFNLSADSVWQEESMRQEIFFIRQARHLPFVSLVLLMETITSEALVEEILGIGRLRKIPVFALDKPHEGCINVTMDYREGFRRVVRHIVEDHGCKRVNMIAGIKGNSFSEERIDAYRQVLADNGIPFEEDRLDYGDFWDMPAKEATERFLARGELPEAIVCANDSMAIAACAVLRDHGIRVPEDILVAGFDGIMSGVLNDPPISSVVPDYHAQAAFVVERTREGISPAGEEMQEDKGHIQFVLSPNRSCGCKGEGAGDVASLVSAVSASFNDTNWYVSAMNRMLARAATSDSLLALAQITEECIGLWRQDFHFIAMFAELAAEDGASAGIEGDAFTQLLRCEQGELQGLGETYSVETFLPGIGRLASTDSGINLLIARLLYPADRTFGYAIEGLGRFNNRDLRRCEEFGMFVSTALNTVLNNRELQRLNQRLMRVNKEIEQISVRDYLTGIFNRRGFYAELADRIDEAAGSNRWLMFFSIDMDGLKGINDTYGHEDGDLAIRMMAAAIAHFAARNGICARFGGDEFACALITEDRIEMDADLVRARFDDTLKNRQEIQGKPYAVSASVGICTVSLMEGRPDIEAMIREADAAMYLDKQARKKGRA